MERWTGGHISPIELGRGALGELGAEGEGAGVLRVGGWGWGRGWVELLKLL